MNLITNRCLGAYIYRDILKEKYENPFIWTGIWDEYFNPLFEKFDTIDFSNFEVLKDTEHKVEKYYVLIDGLVRVNYGHVILDRNAIEPIARDVNIYTDDPVKYIQRKYQERLSRMVNDPVFIYMDLDYTKNYEISEIAKKTSRKIRILTVDEEFPENEFTKKIVIAHQDWKKVPWWKHIMNNHYDKILDLIK